MVVFSRKLQEEIVVDEINGPAHQLTVKILEINEGWVCLGIELSAEAPRPVDRRHPEIRDLVATLWRHGKTLRNRAACASSQNNPVQEFRTQESPQNLASHVGEVMR